MLNWYCLLVINKIFNLKKNQKTLTFISPFSDKGHGCKSFVDFCNALSVVKCAKTSMVYVG
jgi:hypothetical protein